MAKHLPLILLTLLAFSCSKNNDNTTQNNVSGKFTISSFSTNLKSASIAEPSDSTSFVLDTVKSSRSFYFIIGNSGQEDITNVTLTTDNANFNVTPSAITILPGTNSNQSSTVTQVISLDVIHGTRINGVGYTGLLNMGNNYCNLTITGQTSDGKDAISLSFKAKIQVFAQVMNVTLSQGTREFDFAKPDGGVVGLPGISYAPTFNCNPSPALYLKNTGDVTIYLNLLNSDSKLSVLQSSTLKMNDSIALDLSSGPEAYVQLNSQGTIFDQTKFALASNGDAYFGLNIENTYVPPVVTPPVDSTQVLKTRIAK